jgi:hypothetical protein
MSTRLRILVVSIIATLALSAWACGSASAIAFIWMVEGARLAENATKTLKRVNAAEKITFTSGSYTIVCNTMESKAGNAKEIQEKERGLTFTTLEFKECSVTAPVNACEITGGTTLTTSTLTGEIVEGVGASAGKVLLWFGRSMPRAAYSLEFQLQNKGGTACPVAGMHKIYGALLAEAEEPKRELENQTFKFEPAQSQNYVNYGAEAKLGGWYDGVIGAACPLRVKVSAVLEIELEPVEKFGAF